METDADIKIIVGARRVRVMVYEEMDKSFVGGIGSIVPGAERESWQRDRLNPGALAEENYKRRKKARRDAVYSIIYNNFQQKHTSMITLTFAAAEGDTSVQNLHTCHHAFKKFIQRVNYKYDGFKYVATFSQQENKNWHYHIVSNLTDISTTELQELWGNGFTWFYKIQNDGELRGKATYCVENMNEAAADELKWEKGYLCSKGLQRNIVLRTWNAGEAEDCRATFEKIAQSPSKLLYKSAHHVGVKMEVDTDEGTKATRYTKNAQLDDELIAAGGEEWHSTYHHIKSDMDTSPMFNLLPSATRRAAKIEPT